MTDEPLNPDAIDEATDMSPREAAEAVVIKLPGKDDYNAEIVEVMLSNAFAAGALVVVSPKATEPIRRTLRHWHARQSAALLERVRAERAAGYFDGIQHAKAVFETGGENALRQLVQDARAERLKAVLDKRAEGAESEGGK